MRCRMTAIAAIVAVATSLGQYASALSLLTPGDPIVAIDMTVSTGSSNPGAESVDKILDGLNTTKYLNFGKTRTGFIVTPAAAAALQSFVITTANDAEGRDPANYELYGTNDAITSTPHLQGNNENWTLIQSGPLALPMARQTASAPVDVTNVMNYSSYKMIFPDLKDTAGVNSMQIADVAFFSMPAGAGANMLSAGDFIIPIKDGPFIPTSNHPAGEAANFAIDAVPNTKYLNFSKEDSGFIVTPSVGGSRPTAIQFRTANDAPERDPTSYIIWGTNEAITTPDNGIGDDQNWTLITQGTVDLPTDRLALSDVLPIDDFAGYFTSYRITFPTLRDTGIANSMQIDEVILYGAVPEPSTYALVMMGLVAAGFGRRALRRAA